MMLDTQIDDSDPRLQKRYYFEDTSLRRFTTATITTVFRSMAVIHTRGIEKLPLSGPVILAANHLTNFDVFPMQIVLPRLIFYMGKAELFKNPLLDAYLRRLGAFPVQRGAKDEWALEHACKVLEHGQVLGMFPEGTRSKGYGLRTAKTGIARLALATGAPIVPMAITGTHRMFRRFPRRTRLTITLGDPIFPQPKDTTLGLTDQAMFALAGLLPPKLRGEYAQHPAGFD
jgi:1-acyl-sn-glycerol-3-phosphate acyltransferase